MELSQFKTLEQLAAAIKSLDMVTAVPWTDYSEISTITGWTSYTVKVIRYMKTINKLVFVQFLIAGESDTTNANFTLPFVGEIDSAGSCWGRDDGGTRAATIFYLDASVPDFDIYWGGSATGFTNSGTKEAYGQFWYQTA